MAKKLVVAEATGIIYDAVLSKTPGVMTSKRKDRTDECISAVAEHMKHKANYNEKNRGFWQYQWPGIGTLTWKSEKKASSKMRRTNFEHDGCKGCKYESETEEIDYCKGCKQNAVDKYTRMTNADRIRSMTDDELAEFLTKQFCHGIGESLIKEWLESEVEE